MDHTLVFVPSYFDFVKVRNWFKKEDLDYSEISEYTKDKKVAQVGFYELYFLTFHLLICIRLGISSFTTRSIF